MYNWIMSFIWRTHVTILHMNVTSCHSHPPVSRHDVPDSLTAKVLQHTAKTLQHTATHCDTLRHTTKSLQHTATHCNIIQHTATHCNTLPKHRNTLQHTATQYNTLQHTAKTLHQTATNTATHCNLLQHTATHCNILQHTATHCNTPLRTHWIPCLPLGVGHDSSIHLGCVTWLIHVPHKIITIKQWAHRSPRLPWACVGPKCNTLQHTATHSKCNKRHEQHE